MLGFSALENYTNMGADLQRAEWQEKINERQYERNLEASSNQNRQDFRFQLASGLSAARIGAENAGFSPLAALGQHQSFTPASGSIGSSALPNAGIGGNDELLKAISLKTQLDNLNSNTRKNNADAENQEIKNMEEEDKNATASANYQRLLTSLQQKYKDDPEKLEQIKLLGDPQTVYSSGSLQAQREFVSLLCEMSDYDKKKAENEFTQLLNKQLISDKRYKEISEKYHLDNIQAKQHIFEVAQKIVNMRLEALKIAQDTSTSESQKRLNEASIDKIGAEIQNVLVNADKTYHSDYASMWRNNDFQSMIVSLAAEATKAAAAAAGFAVASRVVGPAGAAKPLTAKLKQTLNKFQNKASKTMNPYEWAKIRQEQLNASGSVKRKRPVQSSLPF